MRNVRLSIRFIVLLMTAGGVAQTNTFPANGNVGIGTTSPYSPLTVQTNVAWNGISLFDGSGQIAFIVNDGAGGAQLGLQNINDNRYVQFDTNGPSFFDGGNVGIGTQTPRNNLDIIASNATLNIDSSTANAGAVAVQLLHNDGAPNQEKVAIFSQAVGTWGRGNLIFALDGLNDNSNVSPSNAVMTLLDCKNYSCFAKRLSRLTNLSATGWNERREQQ